MKKTIFNFFKGYKKQPKTVFKLFIGFDDKGKAIFDEKKVGPKIKEYSNRKEERKNEHTVLDI